MTVNPDVAAQLTGRRILVTNDDGIDADGLGLLERVARKYSDDVWVIAPRDAPIGAVTRDFLAYAVAGC